MTPLRLLIRCVMVLFLLTPGYTWTNIQKQPSLGEKHEFIRNSLLKMINKAPPDFIETNHLENAGYELGNCKAEMRSEMLNLPEGGGYIYYPTCVGVSRCSGCCGAMKTSCTPNLYKLRDIQVLKVKAASYLTATEEDIKNGQFISVTVTDETECACDCDISSGSCNMATHRYNMISCTCECQNIWEMMKCPADHETLKWDYNECKCICKHKKKCSSGQIFDNKTCECSLQNNWMEEILAMLRKPES